MEVKLPDFLQANKSKPKPKEKEEIGLLEIGERIQSLVESVKWKEREEDFVNPHHLDENRVVRFTDESGNKRRAVVSRLKDANGNLGAVKSVQIQTFVEGASEAKNGSIGEFAIGFLEDPKEGTTINVTYNGDYYLKKLSKTVPDMDMKLIWVSVSSSRNKSDFKVKGMKEFATIDNPIPGFGYNEAVAEVGHIVSRIETDFLNSVDRNEIS